jgi:hypothetical protein
MIDRFEIKIKQIINEENGRQNMNFNFFLNVILIPFFLDPLRFTDRFPGANPWSF